LQQRDIFFLDLWEIDLSHTAMLEQHWEPIDMVFMQMGKKYGGDYFPFVEYGVNDTRQNSISGTTTAVVNDVDRILIRNPKAFQIEGSLAHWQKESLHVHGCAPSRDVLKNERV
jgi:hypothetical protein